MTTLLRILRLYPLALWVGGEVFFVVVAAVAFGVLPDAHMAGMVVRGALIDLHWIGIYGGVIYLLATLALMTAQRGMRVVRVIETVLAVVMLMLTLYSQRSVIPRMEKDRLAVGGDVNAAPKDNPARVEFDRLHSVSVDLEGAVLIAGLVLLALAPIQTNGVEHRTRD
ncbi:MAG TPA: DUF4149 domain-containing protein [Acidobacteriaceae bacterium]|jgi:uncharacterized membrane protein